MIYAISIICVFSIIIFVHELGHYLAARSVGIRVEKFYIGFNLFGLGLNKKIGETEYGIGAFPLGGYVKVSGIVDESMDMDTTGAEHEYLSKTSLQQLWFSSAGVIMNFILSLVLFTFIFLFNGLAEADTSAKIGELVDNYPAKEIGLIKDDVITSINGNNINNWNEMTDMIHSYPNKTISIEWERGGKLYSDSITTKSVEKISWNGLDEKGIIGIGPNIIIRPIGIIEAIENGAKRTFFWLNYTAQSFYIMIKGEVSIKEIGGPVMIAKMVGDSAKSGIWTLLTLMAIISINLGFINILPIPGLDGGHALISIIEGISRKKLPAKIKVGIQQAGMLLLLGFIIFVIYNDITRIL